MKLSYIYAKLLCIAICAIRVHSEYRKNYSRFSLANLAHRLVSDCKIGLKQFRVKDDSEIKVGIVGAGITGLYAAILLQDLGINYEILEATDRIGGRFYTYHFDKLTENNYVELGAMRFPKDAVFDRIIGKQNWSLINYINSKMVEEDRLSLIKFSESHENNVFYFNGKLVYRSQFENNKDLFGFGKSDGGIIDDKYTSKNAYFWVKKAFDYIGEQLNGDQNSGYNFLLKNDYQSFRSFLMDPSNDIFAYPSDVIDWIEAILAQTGWSSFSLMDGYLQNSLESYKTVKIDGGFSRLPEAMVRILKNKPITKTVVRKVRQRTHKSLIVKTNRGEFEYSHVIMTPSFPVMRDIDFECDLHLKKRLVMRTLENTMAVKVGLLFKTRFWENAGLMNNRPIFGGISNTDLRIREIIYPSFGKNCSSCPGALICSYTQYRDARKFLSFTEKEVADQCLNDVTTIHGPIVKKQYTGKYKVMDWSKHKWTQGGFSTFEPGYFMSYYPYLIHPDANGRLHFAGEAISAFHGWSCGSTTSGFRAVRDMLTVQGMSEKIKLLETNWGTIDEPDFTNFS